MPYFFYDSRISGLPESKNMSIQCQKPTCFYEWIFSSNLWNNTLRFLCRERRLVACEDLSIFYCWRPSGLLRWMNFGFLVWKTFVSPNSNDLLLSIIYGIFSCRKYDRNHSFSSELKWDVSHFMMVELFIETHSISIYLCPYAQ